MPLMTINNGEECKIVKVGGNPETKLFLESLGFVPGAFITVMSEVAGNIIVNIKSSRVAIGKDLATKIMVTK